MAQNSNDSMGSITAEGFVVGETDGSWCDVFPLSAGSKLSVGRGGSNDVVVFDSRCSREHCEFRKLHGRWYVCDLGSSNGTWVNGKRIESVHLLHPGDRIDVASRKLLYAPTLVDPEDIVADFSMNESGPAS